MPEAFHYETGFAEGGSKRVGYILAIDLGTSGPKVGIVDPDGRVVGSEFEANPIYLLPGGGAEQDPDDWWRAIVHATKRLLERRVVSAAEIIAVACTGQWSGTVALGRDGKHLMNAIIWMDSRGAPHVHQTVHGAINVSGYSISKLYQWVRLTGGMPTGAGKDSIAHILYIKSEHPQIYEQTEKFLEPVDYLGFRLTGRKAASYASITLHWLTDNRDIQNIVYDVRLPTLAGVHKDRLPELLPVLSVLGTLTPEAARELGLSEAVKVVVGAPDVHSAAVGSGAIDDYQAHLYIGTSSWLVCHLPIKRTNITLGMASLPSALPGKYLVIGEQESAGICLNYLRDQLFFPDDELAQGRAPENIFKIFDAMAANAPAGSQGLIFTPWLYGERAPVEDPYVRGGFFNQSLKTSRAHMLRSVYEGVAFNSRWLLESMEKFTHCRLDNLRLVGGGAQSEIWCQIFADVLNRTVYQVKDPIHANMVGMAFLAYLGLGMKEIKDIADFVQVEQMYQPQPECRSVYDALFREYVRLYRQLKPIYTRLNRHKHT
mgnify:FL=1